MIGYRSGRLLVLYKSERECPSSKTTYWVCICDCGNHIVASRSNLLTGNVQSCGCLIKDAAIIRGINKRKPPKKCKIEGCENTIEKGANGLCGMHYARNKRHGDTNVMPYNEWRLKCRACQPRLGEVQPQTYKKNMGKHEHRKIMEEHLGRKLNSDEIVHHIDGNRHNNSIDNLMIMTRREHLIHHGFKKNV